MLFSFPLRILQILVESVVADVTTVQSRLSTLALFSSNELFEEVSVRHLPFAFVPYILAEMEQKRRALEPEARIQRLVRANVSGSHKFIAWFFTVTQEYFKGFIQFLDEYGVISDTEKKLHPDERPTDATKARELKVAQYKAEKALKANIEVGLNTPTLPKSKCLIDN